jgi:hypothetical protein
MVTRTEDPHGVRPARAPRICMPTMSAFSRSPFRAGMYEAQDILAECDDVDFIELKPAASYDVKSRWMKTLAYHDATRRVTTFNPGLQRVKLTRDYDLFLQVCSWWTDVWNVNAIDGWKDRCRTTVCWLDEFWIHDVHNLRYWLPILGKFDHVVIGTSGSSPVVGKALGRACHELQGGVDTIRFSPFPHRPPRVVDFYSIGRAHKGIHHRLLQQRRRDNFFYVHDTLDNVAAAQISDHRQHRDMYASLAKRSQFFAVAPGKFDSRRETHGQVALGLRYFEGAAAGCVLVGQPAPCEGYFRHFDWPHAVIEVQPDGSDVVDAISQLSADPELLKDMSCHNAEQALRRHDWVYRWKELLRIAGLAPSAAMAEREARLAVLADLARDARAGSQGL